MKEKRSNQKDINIMIKLDLSHPNIKSDAVDIDLYSEIKSTSDHAPRQHDLSSFESVQLTLERIEQDYIVSKTQKPRILKQIEEYFRLKEDGAPSAPAAQWIEICRTLKTFVSKAEK